MKGTPWEKWFPGDWERDGCVQKCSLATKGAWFEMLNVMFSENSDNVSGSLADLGRLIGATESEALAAINEIDKNGVANVTRHAPSQKNTTIITLTSRRRKRDLSRKKSAAGRAKKYRVTQESRENNASVTGERLDVRCQTSEIRDTKATTLCDSGESAHGTESASAQTTKKPKKRSATAKGDPLEKLPTVAAFYPKLCGLFEIAYPSVKHKPTICERGRKYKNELRLAVKDGISEQDLVATLQWWLTHADAVEWRETYCRSIMSLRIEKNNGTKIAQMNARRTKSMAPDRKEYSPPKIERGRTTDGELPF